MSSVQILFMTWYALKMPFPCTYLVFRPVCPVINYLLCFCESGETFKLICPPICHKNIDHIFWSIMEQLYLAHNYDLFSAPESKAQVHYCDHALSVVRLSVCPSVVNFSHFRLLLWNRWKEFNVTWQESRSQRPLPSLCFSGRSEKQDGRPGLWLAETFSTSPLKPLNRIRQNLTGSKISTSSTKFVFFGSIGKTRWPPWPLIGWYIFNFSSETTERNSTKLDRKQDLNVLYQVWVFRVDRKKKMATLASDWLRHFQLLIWTRWMEFNEIWEEARFQRPLPSFSGRSGKKMGVPVSRWLRNFQLFLLNRWTELNQTWQVARSQCPLSSLCFLGRLIYKNDQPGLSIKKVAYCTQVHVMWPFGPLVAIELRSKQLDCTSPISSMKLSSSILPIQYINSWL